MNADTTRDRLQQIAAAAITGNRLMAKLKLQAATETAAEHPEAWIWQAWTADSPSEAIASLERAASIGLEHPLVEAGFAWFAGLEQLAAGEYELKLATAATLPAEAAIAPRVPDGERAVAGAIDPEAALLDALTAIHDEVFASLYANSPHDIDELQAVLRPCGGPAESFLSSR